MSISYYLSILLSLSTIIIDSSASENVTINGITITATPTVQLNTFKDVSASASSYPKSISRISPLSITTASDEILIGEYKSNEDYLDCQAGKYYYNMF